MACLDEEALAGLFSRTLQPPAAEAVEAHLDGCPACRGLVADLLRAQSSPVPGGADPEPDPSPDPLEPGAELLGRYVILKRIGLGSMGVVFAAYDARLDRKVALKLLRRGRWSAADRSDGEARLLREAQALGRVSHPNIVVVHDVGTVGDDVFMAMEFVDGQNLRRWLTGAPRPAPAAIIQAFTAAGRGLAAAHAAGIIHRDFKPDNVLIGADGRVRVTDFGLARQLQADHDLAPDPQHPAPTDPAAADLTRTGTLVGTPLYMAPEQFAGARVDARSDQFSFCVALHLALFGQHPFAGDTLDELSAAVREGRRRAPLAGPRPQLPPRVQRALARGLATDPAQRFPNMDALCDALAGRPGRPLVIGLLLTLILVVGLVLAAVLTDRRLGPEAAGGALCDGAERRLAGVWDATRKAQLRARFSGADAEPLAVFEREVDAFLARWLSVHAATCKATYAAGTQAQPVFETQFRCLHRQLAELEVTLAAATTADLSAATTLPWAISAHLRPEACVDVNRLLASWERGERSTPVTDQLAQAVALAATGDSAAALQLAQDANAAAAALGDRRLQAEALLQLGRIEIRTGDPAAAERTLRRALTTAEAAGADVHVAEMWFELSSAVSALGRHREALDHVDHAFAWTVRVAHPELFRATLFHHRGVVLDAMGRFEEAEPNHRIALSIRQNLPGAPPLAIAASLNMLGSAMLGRGRLDEALALYQQALALREAVLGPHHSRVAGSLNNIGQTLTSLGRTDEAAPLLARALAIRRASGGDDDIEVALVLENLGRLAHATGDLDGALAHFERSREIHERALGPTHPRVGVTHTLVASALADQGQHARALAAHHRALDLLERAAGPDSPILVDPLTGIGLALLAQGSPAEAVPALERALALAELGSTAPDARARPRFALARAWTGHDRPHGRARDLAEEARQLYTAAGPRFEREATVIAAWLAP